MATLVIHYGFARKPCDRRLEGTYADLKAELDAASKTGAYTGADFTYLEEEKETNG